MHSYTYLQLLKCCILFHARKHEWFQRDLPAYLFPSPVEQDSSVIDTDAVNEVCEVSQQYNIIYRVYKKQI
jgi:hypothetical protein